MKTDSSQFGHLVSKTSQGVFAQLFLICFLTIMLRKVGFPAMTLYLWDVCAAALLMDRYFNFRHTNHDGKHDSQQIGRMKSRYAANVFFMGVLWAVLFAQFFQYTSIGLHYLALAVAYGISGAAIATLGAVFRLYFLFVFPMLATLIWLIYLQGSFIDIVTAVIIFLGTGYLLYAVYKYGNHFQLMNEQADRLCETEMEALICLGKAGEYRDADTGNHVLRVGYSSYLLAKSAGFSEQDAETLMNSSPLHDLGKIGIPDSILRKPGKLTEAEQYVMQNHTRIGAEILRHSQSSVMRVARIVALSHHEKWDGSGFPEGLSGKAIPIEGRIVAICDVFDALVSSRHYKQSWTNAEAIAYLREGSGSHFDPDLVELFIRNIPQIKKFTL